MISRGLVVAILAGCTACNLVLGLEETRPLEPVVDTDLDEVPDDEDNCVMVANTDQGDRDGDGAGDACDGCDACEPCARLPDHDEDGDKLADGCDNCPALANLDQANRDGDDLGDVCDASPAVERRLLFEGFGALGDDWLEAGAQWEAAGDHVGPRPDALPGATYTLQHAALAIPSGTRWYIEVGLVTPPAGDRLGFFAGSSSFCLVDHREDGEWRILASATQGEIFAATFGPIIRLRMTPTGAPGAQAIDCAIVDVRNTTNTLGTSITYPLTPQFVTTSIGPQFAYIDVAGE